MRSLVTHHFLFTAEVVTPLELNEHSGAALRGNFFEALWRRFCTNKAAATCADCPLHLACPVSALVAPLREECQRGRDIPRPYIILPPLGTARYYGPGDILVFGLTLFGNIVQLLPYIILSTGVLEDSGLGRKLNENGRRRGKFKIRQIESYNQFSGERQVIYEAGKPVVGVTTLSVTADDVAARAVTLPADRLTINFLTPTRLVDREAVVHHIVFRPFVQRLLERLTALEEEYGVGEDYRSLVECQELLRLAENVQCGDGTTWEEVKSYSQRQRQSMPISGFSGKATFVGNLAPFLELLVWGELVHVGKSCVKGNGWYRIEN
jgi:hypothetical protein